MKIPWSEVNAIIAPPQSEIPDLRHHGCRDRTVYLHNEDAKYSLDQT